MPTLHASLPERADQNFLSADSFLLQTEFIYVSAMLSPCLFFRLSRSILRLVLARREYSQIVRLRVLAALMEEGQSCLQNPHLRPRLVFPTQQYYNMDTLSYFLCIVRTKIEESLGCPDKEKAAVAVADDTALFV